MPNSWQDKLKQLVGGAQSTKENLSTALDSAQKKLPENLQGTSLPFGVRPPPSNGIQPLDPLSRAPIENVDRDVEAHKAAIASIIRDSASQEEPEQQETPPEGDMQTDIAMIRAANPTEYQEKLKAILTKYGK